MEIFMKNVSWSATHTDLVLLLAEELHSPVFMGDNSNPMNFHVHLPWDNSGAGRPHRGFGYLTVPTQEIGIQFLEHAADGLFLCGRWIYFLESHQVDGKPDIIQSITKMRYIDPRIQEAEDIKSEELSASRVSLRTIQFGWDCRDHVMSIESEASPEACCLSFDEDRRQFRVEFIHENFKYHIAIRFSQIQHLTAHLYLQQEPVILLKLLDPPAYERDLHPCRGTDGYPYDMMSESDESFDGPCRKQLSFLPVPQNHQSVAPYTGLALRFVCTSKLELQEFSNLAHLAGFNSIVSKEYRVERRNLFSPVSLEHYERWTRALPWTIAFQVIAIVNRRSVNVQEMLDILPDIGELNRARGKKYVALLLQDFASKVCVLDHIEAPEDKGPTAVRLCLEQTLKNFDSLPTRQKINPTDGSLCEVFHVTVTPTSMVLDGPNPERSNRVFRAYPEEHQESFLRVTFAEEGRLQLRFDRDIDSRVYLRDRVAPILFNGLTIAKRTFHFLAYSQSALKEHSVWFCKPFQVDGRWVAASDIIESLGNFDNLEFDPQLPYCPARYAARISQAFTATDASVSVNIEEIIHGQDITVQSENQTFNFTDGVGTMSLAVAEEIWKKLKTTRKRLRSVRGHPAAYQIRFKGSKGMLSIDHRLQGRLIVLRPSMIKFEAPQENNVEIARAFDRPTAYFLNRPLIMILEGLGVPFEVFKRFQDLAVQQTEEAIGSRDFNKTGKLLECHGLGTSFRVSSVMNSLSKMGLSPMKGDTFYDKSLDFARNHILRLLKNHARIPIPGAWTLVGVADVHKFLKPQEIFACVRPLNGQPFYLEGPVVISRSPTIHPGDVQVAYAIGRPPPGSCFEKQPLANTVVFSVLGDRPLSSCLGGGDLDGDVYNIIPLKDPQLAGFRPRRTFEPAKYPPAQKKLLDRRSTMRDVAEFVMDYIVSDLLGIVAITWLIIADQSPFGIEDDDCINLANLHSDAVDYPKSGYPVDRQDIPRLQHREKPDWNAPETIDVHTSRIANRYYESQTAIGKLFRGIDLPAEKQSTDGATRIYTKSERHDKHAGDPEEHDASRFWYHPYHLTLEMVVEQHIETEEQHGDLIRKEAEELLQRYTTELQGICITKTLSSARDGALSEEEAMIGTIVQRTSQPRRRTDMIARLRESTDILVRGIREALEGPEDDTEEDFLQRAWFAWELSLDKGREFGAQSFGWVALGGIFEALRKIEEREIQSRPR